MLGPKILPAIFLVLPPTVLLMAQASAGKPVAQVCSIRPGSSAPQGTHWYYRVRQTDNRRCWFLRSEGTKVRSYTREVMSDVASQSPAPKRDNTSEAAHATPPRTTSAQIASVQMAPEQATAADPAFSETPVREHAAAMDLLRVGHISQNPRIYMRASLRRSATVMPIRRQRRTRRSKCR